MNKDKIFLIFLLSLMVLSLVVYYFNLFFNQEYLLNNPVLAIIWYYGTLIFGFGCILVFIFIYPFLNKEKSK